MFFPFFPIVFPSLFTYPLHGQCSVYAREGAGHPWLVDLVDRTLKAFELHEGRWLLIASAKDENPAGIRPFDTIILRLGDLRL